MEIWTRRKSDDDRRIYTLCLKKNDIDVAHYNFDAYQPIWVIFGRAVAEKVCYHTVICYPTFVN